MSKVGVVLVTGGAGFIGSHVVDGLIELGREVRVLDDLSAGTLDNIGAHLNAGRVDFVKGDIRDEELVSKCLKDVDVVLHFAALTSVPFSVKNPQATYDVNLSGTFNLLSLCAQKKVDRFLFVSSCAVYGEPEFLPVTEEHPKNPVSPYAKSKLMGEHYCLGFHKMGLLRSAVLRFFNVYGPRQGVSEYSGVISRFIENCRQGLPLTIYGDGSQTRDFVYVKDVANAVLKCLEKNDAWGEAFNVGSGLAVTIKKLAETIFHVTGAPLDILYDEYRLGDIKDSCADISKAEGILGYKPKVSLKAGLRALLNDKAQAKEC